MGSEIFMMVFMFLLLGLSFYIAGKFGYNNIRYRIIIKNNWDRVNIYNVLRWFMVFSFFSMSQIDLHWYYIFLPISITWSYIMWYVYQRNVMNDRLKLMESMSDNDIEIYKRNELLEKILK